MFAKSIIAATLLAAKAAATIYYAGVAESGGEFGVYSTSPKYIHGEIMTDDWKAVQQLQVPDFQEDSE